MHRRVILRANDHECPVLTKKWLFAPHEAIILASRELWLFCPWCGEQVADLIECGPEYTREVHIASRTDAIGTGDIEKVNCGMTLDIEEIVFSDYKHYLHRNDEKLCQECVFQIPRLETPPFSMCGERGYFHPQVKGKVLQR